MAENGYIYRVSTKSLKNRFYFVTRNLITRRDKRDNEVILTYTGIPRTSLAIFINQIFYNRETTTTKIKIYSYKPRVKLIRVNYE